MMDPLLRQLRNQTLRQMVAPRHRFFRPLEAFYDALKEFQHVGFIDAGTGSGELPEEAAKRGFKMLGIDLVPRPGQSPNVVFAEAETFEYSPTQWLLMCRPDHSGWVYDALEAALRSGAGAIYISKPSNMTNDLDEYASRATRVWRDVGEDGECMMLFMPDALLPESAFA